MDMAVTGLVHRFNEIDEVPCWRNLLRRDDRAIPILLPGRLHGQGAVILVLVHAAIAQADPFHACRVANLGGEGERLASRGGGNWQVNNLRRGACVGAGGRAEARRGPCGGIWLWL